MKRTLPVVIIALAFLAASCGTSAKRTLNDPDIPYREVNIDEGRMEIYLDDHTRTRKNADRIFEKWIESRGMQRHLTGKRLLSISPKPEGCRLTYDFRLMDGTEQRVVLIVKECTQCYRKRHRRTDSAVVNGQKYNFYR